MRGKEIVVKSDFTHTGITPAHAGKRVRALRESFIDEDHPRTCGEKFPSTSFNVVFPGSPPHMRGKVTREIQTAETSWITPAHAGKSDSKGEKFHGARDHPRTCGEKW